jgi:hypothetical protein
MKKVLALAAAAEAVTGMIVLAYPPIAVWLLFGAEITGAGIVVSRIAGISLIGLGLACWPNGSASQPLDGMLAYGTLVTLYLIYIGVRGEGVGLLLWPGVAAHAILVILLVRARSKERAKASVA